MKRLLWIFDKLFWYAGMFATGFVTCMRTTEGLFQINATGLILVIIAAILMTLGLISRHIRDFFPKYKLESEKKK